ncbi:unnamed protein product [Rhizophagus irregularis]|uniref:Sel1 repeat family protein n=1 Tax=Rhizophagus irregularis TaxID=588596 RepID=A0A915ZV76_9GLOM|nr:unnamed protein product [Rhizophagus irregularis]CAB5388620.1 unnamed protein product [Rhizophagus irregularis]
MDDAINEHKKGKKQFAWQSFSYHSEAKYCEGVAINSIEALKYLKMAANQENPAAMYIIGKAYLECWGWYRKR